MNISPKSVFIVGTAYSGSSILGAHLHSQFMNVAYIGELSRVQAFRKKYYLDQADGVCQTCLIAGRDCQIFSEVELKKIGAKSPLEAHRHLAAIYNATTVIDGSKHPAWLREFIKENSPLNFKVLLAVRNPKKYVQSCLDRGIGEAWQAANAWRDTYIDAIRTINTLGLAQLIVRNEDLLQNESKILAQVEDFLGLENRATNKSEVIHTIGGNPAAQISMFGAKKVKKRTEELGRSVLDLNPVHKGSFTKQKITFDTQVLFNTPGLSDLANILGYNASELI